MDMLKHNDWINFSEYEYQNSLIPKTSQTVSEVQQFVNNNLSRTIENGVFQNPRVAAMRSRRNSMSDNLYAGAGSVGTGYETLDNVKPSTFTILGHGGFGYDSSSAGGVGTTDESNETEYERMLRYSKAGATTPILKDKITTGSNFRFVKSVYIRCLTNVTSLFLGSPKHAKTKSPHLQSLTNSCPSRVRST